MTEKKQIPGIELLGFQSAGIQPLCHIYALKSFYKIGQPFLISPLHAEFIRVIALQNH